MNRDVFLENLKYYFPFSLTIFSGLLNAITFFIAYSKDIVWLMVISIITTTCLVLIVILVTTKISISPRETEIGILECKDQLIILDRLGKEAKLIKTLTLSFSKDSQTYILPLMSGPGKLSNFKVYLNDNPNMIFAINVIPFGGRRCLNISFDRKYDHKTVLSNLIVEMDIQDGFLDSQVGFTIESEPGQELSCLEVVSARQICDPALWYVLFGKSIKPIKTGKVLVLTQQDNSKCESRFQIDFSPYISKLAERNFSTNWIYK